MDEPKKPLPQEQLQLVPVGQLQAQGPKITTKPKAPQLISRIALDVPGGGIGLAGVDWQDY